MPKDTKYAEEVLGRVEPKPRNAAELSEIGTVLQRRMGGGGKICSATISDASRVLHGGPARTVRKALYCDVRSVCMHLISYLYSIGFRACFAE